MKRLLFIFAFVLLSSQAAFATITPGDFTDDFAPSGAISTSSSTAANHAAGSAIFVTCSTSTPSGNTVSGVSNTAGDTFISTANAKRTGAVATRTEIWYVLSSIGNAADVVTCTWTGNVSFPLISTAEFAHTGALTFDVASPSSAEAGGTSYPVGTFSTAGAGLILYGVNAGANTYTAPATPAFISTGLGWMAYRITSGVESSITPAGTGTTNNDWSAVALAVTESGGGGGAVPSGLLLMGVGN